jgi:hypothetical protein
VLAVIPGLSAKSADGASAFAYPLIFLPFISSALVPTDTMPAPVRAFADNQPVTSIVNAIRDLLTQQPVGTNIWISLAWCAATAGLHERLHPQSRLSRLVLGDLAVVDGHGQGVGDGENAANAGKRSRLEPAENPRETAQLFATGCHCSLPRRHGKTQVDTAAGDDLRRPLLR